MGSPIVFFQTVSPKKLLKLGITECTTGFISCYWKDVVALA